MEFLIRHLLRRLQHALGAIEIDVNGFALDAQHDGCQDLGFLLDIFVVDHAALCLADALDDHLLGRLRRDAPEVTGRDLHFHDIAQLVLVAHRRVVHRDFQLRIFNLIHNLLLRVNRNLAGDGVQRHACIGGGVKVLFVGGHQRLFDGFEQNLLFDSAGFAKLVQRFNKLNVHAFTPPLCPHIRSRA